MSTLPQHRPHNRWWLIAPGLAIAASLVLPAALIISERSDSDPTRTRAVSGPRLAKPADTTSAHRVLPSTAAAAAAAGPSTTAVPAQPGTTGVAVAPATAPWPAPPTGPRAVPAGSGAPTDRLRSDDGSLDTHVGTYSDCNADAALPRHEAEIDTCVRGLTYFLGHNPGVFAPLMHMGPGAVLTWYDHAGTAHAFRIVDVRDLPNGASPRSPHPDVIAQFQTCLTPDGAYNHILDAVPATPSSAMTAADPSTPAANLLNGLLTIR